MKNIYKLILGFILFSSLAGCALVPEQLAVNPNVQTSKSTVGKNNRVAVKIIDARPTTSLGGRPSGYGPAANIDLKNNLSDVVQRAIYEGLRAKNFQPVAANASAARRLTVRIVGLNYDQQAGFFTAGLRISSALEASATNSKSSYDNVYRYSQNVRIVFTPTSNQDLQNVNKALSGSVNQLLNDEKLIKFLSK